MAVMLSTISLSSSTVNLSLKNSIVRKPSSKFQLFTGLDIGRKKEKHYKMDLCLVRCSGAISQKLEKRYASNSRKGDKGVILSEGKDDDQNYGPICPGCGVFMQDRDPNFPGYFQEREKKVKRSIETIEDLLDENFDEFEDDEDFSELEELDSDDDDDDIKAKLEKLEKDGSDWDSDDWESELEDEEDEYSKELDGFAPAGVGYGNTTEETLEKRKRKKVSKAERKRISREAEREIVEVTVCARCHSLRNYGCVKNQVAENLIPDFDFDRLISTRLMKPTGNADATVVVMVVDCVDFEGSFPKRAAKSLFKALAEGQDGKNSKKLPKLVLVATKVDLLPSQISPARLDRWVRHRAKANGAPKLTGVYMVSSRKDLGVRNLLAFIKNLAGPRGNVWVIGSQNAGKSTLINAFSKKEGVKVAKLTEAPIPGTTLGILRIGGILPAKAKMYDTPGLLHPYLMSMRLNRDEQKMAEIRKELQPRTFRIKAGQTIHVGGLVRLDLDQASVQTIYVTIWASNSVSLHLGKMENADETKNKHTGIRLQPPIGEDRVPELGEWVKRDVKASGTTWDVNSVDIAVAGLGWFSIGLKGEAHLSLWTYDGIQITLREPLVLDRASSLERPGFWLPKAISEAIGKQNKLEAKSKREDGEESAHLLSDLPI
ncbi:GTP-binding protein BRASSINAZOLE INSENSITIVE PALE GREEN 2, chloroplastic-like [Salvia splendens]|uniref:GTP-binding protein BRASSINAZOLE INSENSITIVE PALE GREEN 2, chloroplastic-like n=1 Tax=Salvia splendens TaxID=180675 RepID=UPI001C26210F|nr:GTP-binding protein BRASSINAZOLE INSENSITIVE PALE GREEN 2, chloroplastic-like [Salvia splendens]XP_042030749.1 GTP-binding protein BRASSINAZOLE INSENSITIVE PALE GREEN 2, chloroplastic-like [Salvia splendens]XP_042030750.1 GTP-binding protein BRASSINAZOLE INSENSITIVE PALE GREEN 2, chloroplastic-like [Salvia splendens]XP_042030751.1 GTP-binding protein BRASSINAZOLE INSENSITIVE PALE GREEN 2, chloroplastic-like [Salvia splendens]XP_042030752.1 GTP-binding protein BRASSINAZOLE INSENSITIVE PALE GR